MLSVSHFKYLLFANNYYFTQILAFLQNYILHYCLFIGLKSFRSIQNFDNGQYFVRVGAQYNIGIYTISSLELFYQSYCIFFQVVLYSWSTVSHVGVGGVCLLAVVYCLRWELRMVIEKVLLLVAKILGKFGSKSSSRRKDKFSNVMIVDTVHQLLYQT